MSRRQPIGAECVPGGGVDFRVWAPRRKRVELVLEGGPSGGVTVPMESEKGGYVRAHVPEAAEGTTYRFRLDGGAILYPDPASRQQPEGPHGASRVVDPSRFRWTDGAFAGIRGTGQVIYEMHVGTFTAEGTWAAATEQLDELARLGVTVLEVMPIAEFSGRWGWGYDGVSLFAPSRVYGVPDDARRFVDRAHALGLGVILDVVYNHLGPDGNYLPEFSQYYFTDRHKTDWGAAINYDSEGCEGVRELVLANGSYWVDEFHFDGLRLDATQNIYDTSKDHILAALTRAVRAAGGKRATYLVGENEPQDSRLLEPEADGGMGLDALWNDDFHHTACVALTGRSEAYYTDYGGTPQELISALKYGFLYQGQHYAWQKKTRGTPSLDLSPHRFVTFLENHDQVANSGRGDRIHQKTSPGRHRAMTTLLLLGPGTPLLFQGQEFASSKPFLFFADQPESLSEAIRSGRREFLAQFPSLADPVAARGFALPDAESTFLRCKLDLSERDSHAETYAMFKELLALRKDDPTFSREDGKMDGAVLGPSMFVLRFFGRDGDDRVLLVNLGADHRFGRVPEPLLAPPRGRSWTTLVSSEDARFGGTGIAPSFLADGSLQLAGECAVVLAATPVELLR